MWAACEKRNIGHFGILEVGLQGIATCPWAQCMHACMHISPLPVHKDMAIAVNCSPGIFFQGGVTCTFCIMRAGQQTAFEAFDEAPRGLQTYRRTYQVRGIHKKLKYTQER